MPAINKTSMLRGIAALLALFTAAVHTFVGGRDSLIPLLEADIDPMAEGALHASWHIVAIFLAWSSVAFWKGGVVGRHFAGLWIASALAFVGVDLWQAGLTGLFLNPQWAVLAPVGLLAIYGAGPLASRDNESEAASREIE